MKEGELTNGQTESNFKSFEDFGVTLNNEDITADTLQHEKYNVDEHKDTYEFPQVQSDKTLNSCILD